MKIIVYGGSFNPITVSHLEVAKMALDFIGGPEVGTILWAPTQEHAFGKSLLHHEIRIEMIGDVICGMPGMNASRHGMGKYMYTYLDQEMTMMKMLSLADDIQVLIGSDVLEDFPKWHQYDSLVDEYHFLVANRNDDDLEYLTNLKSYDIIGKAKTSVSSTQVRERIKNGQSLEGYVPDCAIDGVTRLWRGYV